MVPRQLPSRADRLVVIGVLNVTPDSFSDGGRWTSLDAAVAHAVAMRADGADLVDVGGESTRPGAVRVDAAEEIRRVVPVVTALRDAGVPTSVDTTRAAVAAAALEAGAAVVNDVSGGLADPGMADVVRDVGCPWILMHWRGHSSRMQQLAVYDDVVADVRHELCARVDAAVAAGVPASSLVIDPGIGFAKTAAHNWALLHRLDALVELGPPMLVGASRKAFLGALLAPPAAQPAVQPAVRPAERRDDATAAITVWSELAGAWGVRVHDVRRSVDAARTARALKEGHA